MDNEYMCKSHCYAGKNPCEECIEEDIEEKRLTLLKSFRLCSTNHAEIGYNGEECPLCEALRPVGNEFPANEDQEVSK